MVSKVIFGNCVPFQQILFKTAGVGTVPPFPLSIVGTSNWKWSMGIGVLLFYPTKKKRFIMINQNVYHHWCSPITSQNFPLKTSPSFHAFERCVFLFSNLHGVLASLALANLKGPTTTKKPRNRQSRCHNMFRSDAKTRNEWRNSQDPILKNQQIFVWGCSCSVGF